MTITVFEASVRGEDQRMHLVHALVENEAVQYAIRPNHWQRDREMEILACSTIIFVDRHIHHWIPNGRYQSNVAAVS